jgi:hypothetical protein
MVVYGNVQCWYHVFWDEMKWGEFGGLWADPKVRGRKREKGNR